MKCEVTNNDFEEVFHRISSHIKQSVFLSIDAEFSGISSSSAPRNSLFDTPEDRYASVRDNIKDYVIIQLGITAYHYNRDENKYTGSIYVFYVRDAPSSVLSVPDKKFNFESSAFDFLSKHGFDFGKLMHDGVCYLNNHEERKLREDFEKCRDSNLVASDETEKTIQIVCTSVTDWLESGDNKKPLILFKKVDYRKKLEIYLTVKRIQQKFPAVWIYKDTNGQVLVEALDPSSQRALHGKKSFVDEEEFMDGCLGVTKLFRLLAKLKKPIVGHNLLLDLMFMYQQFYEPLPTTYKEFKMNVHSLFPVIYDTKFLSYELRELSDRTLKWENNGLSELYEYFKEGHGFHLAPFTPSIELADSEGNALEEHPFHEAGWDSFCTGYCFIRMMHIFAIKKILDCKYEPKPVVSQQHFHAVKPYMNRVNVSRAHINHIRLDGPDPTSRRPNWLIVMSANDAAVDTNALKVHLCNVHGTFDIKTVSNNVVYVAANSNFALTEIKETLTELKVWHVVPYNSTFSSTLIWLFPWFAGLSLGAFLMYRYRLKFE